LTFEQNQGQTQSQVKFLSRGRGYTAFLTADGMVLSLRPAAGNAYPAAPKAPAAKSGRAANLQFKLVGAAANPAVAGEDLQPGRINYFIGNDPGKWHTNVSTYGRVRYRNVYPGIDLVYYGNHKQLEYDFAISPGANPKQIQFEIKGAKKVSIASNGDLILNTGTGELHFLSPAVYQESNGTRVPVLGGYVITDSTHVGFRLAALDASKATVIDPALVYSTYLGGSGDDQPTGIAVDGIGNVYLSGCTDSADFPLATLGALASGSTHAFVAKLDPTGSNLVYADYFGGSNQDYGYALALNSAKEVYLTGSTSSSDFPMVNAYQAVYPGSFNAFLSRISADGSSLLYSTYFGGNGSDIPASVKVDGSSNVLIAGNTTSTNLPVASAYQSTVSANQGGVMGNYGFVTKFSPDGSQLIYSTYLGGSSNIAFNCGGTPCWPSPTSAITGLALDANGNAYAAGNTNTYDFPTTNGAYIATDTTQLDGIVGFVSKFDGSGSLQYSTYFYESSGIFTTVDAIAADTQGSAYVTGLAFSDGTFPLTSTAICDPGVYGEACSYAFVTKFDAAGATLLYSTFLGPNNYASPAAISVDASGDAYVLATTASNSFGLVNGLEAYTSGNDSLVAEIDPTASTQLFATFLGGSGDDNAAGMALDSSGNIYVTGTTGSSDFPISQGGFQGILGGNTDAFISKIAPASAAAVAATPWSLQFPAQSLGTVSQAQTVLLRNMGSAALNVASIVASTNFAETDNCGSSVPAAGSCTLSPTFTPNAVGTLAGSITISDDAAGSPHVISLSGTGMGAVVALTPATLTFASRVTGSTSAAQLVTLTNQGNAGLTISNIAITGDFAQTNTCSDTLAAGASCSFNVTFAPTAAGVRTGTLTITDSAAGSPHTVALTGTGTNATPAVSLTPPTLTFSSTKVGATSAGQTATLTNQGNASLTISNVAVTGDFAQTNNCSSTVAAGANCTFNVTFTPKAGGSRTGALTITDSAAGSPHTVTLSGTGADFSLTSSSTSATVKAGSTATYTLSVAGVNGAFSNAITLACSGAPAKTTCSAAPTSVTPGSDSASVTVTISTTATTSEAMSLFPSGREQPMYAMWMQLQGIGLFGMLVAGSKSRKKKGIVLVLLAVLVAALLFMSACAGGTGISHQGQTGTTPGTYTVTITGTSGSLQHSLPLTLIVQ
jgi:hypothetical protein